MIRLSFRLLVGLVVSLAAAGTLHAAALVVVTGSRIADTCAVGGPASGNGLLDPGETGNLFLHVKNNGNLTATRLRALVSSSDPNLELLLDTLDFADLPAGASAESVAVPFRFSNAATCGQTYVVDVTLAFSGTFRNDTLSIDIPTRCFTCGADPCLPSSLVPFSAGPYGIELNQIAADFMVPTLDGDWSFSANWSGCDNYVFIVHQPGWAYSDTFWASSVLSMLQQSPDNAQYFFLTTATDPAQVATEMADMRTRTDAALSRLSATDRAHWTPRLHHVTTGVPSLGNWITDFLAAHGVTSFAVDSFQRVRQAGLLFYVGGPQSPEMFFMTHEVRHYNYERERQRQLDYETFREITVFDARMNTGQADVVFPTAEEMAGYDTMLFDLSWECTDPWDSLSCEWDYLANLNICDTVDPTSCPEEFGRWITAYGRGGRWITDMTPYMALIREGGPRRLSFYTPYTYDMKLTIRFAKRNKGIHPEAYMRLWGGGNFEDPNYNANHPPIQFEEKPWSRKTEVAALITGHGFGNQAENCAEFCNHQHRFTMNGAVSAMQEFPEAQTQYGCVDQIEIGTVPNQYGTWHYGRGGWCPGLDVPAWSADLSAGVIPGTNTLTYEGLFNGAPYVPTYPGPSPGFGARIDMSSYLVFYAEVPEDDCTDLLDDDGDGFTDCADQGCESQSACDDYDTDGDGLVNSADCDALDGTLAQSPAGPLDFRAVKTDAVTARIEWPTIDAAAGSGTAVDVMTGLVSELRADGDFSRGTCLTQAARAGADDARRIAASIDAYWYIIRARNACGSVPFDPPELQTASPCD